MNRVRNRQTKAILKIDASWIENCAGVLQVISTGSAWTYRDKVDNTVMVGNILMNVHG
jgi:hypothetical protein